MRGARFLSCRLVLTMLTLSLSPGPLLASTPSPPAAFDTCFSNAGARYQIEPLLLKAVAKGESAFRPGATIPTGIKRAIRSARTMG